MATIPVGAGSYLRPVNIARVRTGRWRVDASQTVDVGDILVLSADSDEGNRVKVAGADPTTDRAIVGVAAQAKTTTSSPTYPADEVIVWLATGDAEFLVHCEDAAAIDHDDISVEYGAVLDATNNIWRLDRTETSAKVFRVLKLRDAHGDVNGRLIVQFVAPERLYHD
jgi:hypothetical protein